MSFIKNVVIASVAACVAASASTGVAWAAAPTGVTTPGQCVDGHGQVQGDKCAGGIFAGAPIGKASTYVTTVSECTSGGGHPEAGICEQGKFDDYLIRG